MFIYNLKLTIRNLLKNKVYSAMIIGSFSIGFTACILISLFYITEHNVNKDFPNYKNIYRFYDVKFNKYDFDYKLFPILKNNYSEIANACPFEYYSENFASVIKDAETNNYTSIHNLISTSNSFFQIFSVEIISSLAKEPFSSKESVVITELVAHRLFGSQNPLGKTIRMDDISGKVSAIIKELPENSSFKAEIILNSENEDYQFSQECNDGKCIYPTSHFLVLHNDINPVKFTEKLNSTFHSYNLNVDNLALQNLADIYLSSSLSGDNHLKGNSKLLTIFISIALLIIILSSINYLNYSISMQYTKFKEIGIKKTNGADRKQLMSSTLIEVSIGIIVAFVLSILLAELFMPYTEVLFGRKIYFSYQNLIYLVPIYLIIIFAIIGLNSLAPIYVLSRFKITDFFAGGSARHGNQIGKQIMLTFQFMASIALIAVVLLIFKQLRFVNHYDLGFNKEQLIKIEIPYTFEHSSLLEKEMSKLSFVSSAALSNGSPGNINLSMGSNTKEHKFSISCIYISDNYLKTLGIKLMEGREFHDGDQNRACLMNQEAVKQFGWSNIENKKYNNGNEHGFNVVGVVKNFNVKSLHSGMEPVALLYNPNYAFYTLSLKLGKGNIGQQLTQIQKTWENVLPGEPMSFTFYDEQYQAMYNKEEKLAKSITFFSVIAVLLTCMGLLGHIILVSYARTKEIGIRKVNGAKIFQLIVLLNRDFIKWIAIAFVISCPIAWYAMHNWLETFAYKTELSWWIFALAGLITLGIALITVSWQTWRAARRNPVEALRYE